MPEIWHEKWAVWTLRTLAFKLYGPSLIHVSEKYFYCSSYLEIGDGLWQMQLKSFTHWLLSNFSRLVFLSPSQIQFCSPSSLNRERLWEICKTWSDLTCTIFVKLNTQENFSSGIEIYNFTKKELILQNKQKNWTKLFAFLASQDALEVMSVTYWVTNR